MPAVGAGGSCLAIYFSWPSYLFSFSLSLGDSSIKTEIDQNTVSKPTTFPFCMCNLSNDAKSEGSGQSEQLPLLSKLILVFIVCTN